MTPGWAQPPGPALAQMAARRTTTATSFPGRRGQFVAFRSNASNLVSPDVAWEDVFRHNLADG